MRSFVLLLVLVQSWSGSRSQPSDQVQVLSRSWSGFGSRLFLGLASRSDSNVLVSPSAAAASLSGLQGRSDGTGREQLLKLLTSTDSVSSLRAAVGGASLGGVAWFVASGAEPEETYRKSLEQDFGAEVRTVDFASAQDSVDSIRRWVLDQSQDRVQVQSQGLDLGADPQLVLVSALSLQARFQVPFNLSETFMERFFVDSYSTVMVPMLKTSGRFFLAYDRTLKSGILRLALDQDRALLLLIPDQDVHVSALEDRLSHEQIQTWIRALKKTKLEVQIPRFSLAQSNVLKNDLKKLGLTQVFDDNSLSQVVSGASLVVDETAAEGGVASSFKTSPPRLTVNRPFLLVVYHEPTGTLQLIGRVVDPTQK